MTGLNEYAQWYYLIYLLPGGAALCVLLLSALGGGMHHGHHGGSSHVHSGAGHSHPSAGHRTTGHQAALAARTPFLAAFFGLGRVPAPIVWGSALLGWGVFGFWGTQFWQSVLHLPAAFALPALAVALVGAFVSEKVTVETAVRLLPSDESYAVSAVELCGLTGTAAFPLDAARGRVHVYDMFGTMHDMSARAAPGQAAIARGRTVLIVDYDAVSDQMIVEEAS